MGKLRVYCLKNPKKLSIYPLGNTPSAPSDNTGEEEADPTLELAMEYASALGTIIFDESCRLHDLTEAQVGRNQFTMDMAVDWLDNKIDEVDRRVDQVSE